MEEKYKKKIDIKLGKSDNEGRCVTQCVAWISTSIAVIAGICITKEPACLWAFVLPFML